MWDPFRSHHSSVQWTLTVICFFFLPVKTWAQITSLMATLDTAMTQGINSAPQKSKAKRERDWQVGWMAQSKHRQDPTSFKGAKTPKVTTPSFKVQKGQKALMCLTAEERFFKVYLYILQENIMFLGERFDMMMNRVSVWSSSMSPCGKCMVHQTLMLTQAWFKPFLHPTKSQKRKGWKYGLRLVTWRDRI